MGYNRFPSRAAIQTLAAKICDRFPELKEANVPQEVGCSCKEFIYLLNFSISFIGSSHAHKSMIHSIDLLY